MFSFDGFTHEQRNRNKLNHYEWSCIYMCRTRVRDVHALVMNEWMWTDFFLARAISPILQYLFRDFSRFCFAFFSPVRSIQHSHERVCVCVQYCTALPFALHLPAKLKPEKYLFWNSAGGCIQRSDDCGVKTARRYEGEKTVRCTAAGLKIETQKCETLAPTVRNNRILLIKQIWLFSGCDKCCAMGKSENIVFTNYCDFYRLPTKNRPRCMTNAQFKWKWH